LVVHQISHQASINKSQEKLQKTFPPPPPSSLLGLFFSLNIMRLNSIIEKKFKKGKTHIVHSQINGFCGDRFIDLSKHIKESL